MPLITATTMTQAVSEFAGEKTTWGLVWNNLQYFRVAGDDAVYRIDLAAAGKKVATGPNSYRTLPPQWRIEATDEVRVEV